MKDWQNKLGVLEVGTDLEKQYALCCKDLTLPFPVVVNIRCLFRLLLYCSWITQQLQNGLAPSPLHAESRFKQGPTNRMPFIHLLLRLRPFSRERNGRRSLSLIILESKFFEFRSQQRNQRVGSFATNMASTSRKHVFLKTLTLMVT